VTTHIEHFIAWNNPEDYPDIIEGPFGTLSAAHKTLSQYRHPEDYVVLMGVFPGKHNE
jgi:hypothetical protein